MFKVIFLLLPFILIYTPQLWVRYIFNKYDKEIDDMPFNGYQFGNKILSEKNLNKVEIETTQIGDHYDAEKKRVRVLEQRMGKKSLTSISIVCHEIGHALQDEYDYKLLGLRQTLVKKTLWIQYLGSGIFYVGLPVILATGMPSLIFVCLGIALVASIVNILIHLVTLPVEFDASFNRAMPILSENVPEHYLGHCKSILKAAAYTYLAGSLISIFNVRNLLILFRSIRR